MFCIYLRTNSDLCHLQHKLIGFYNPDEKCLQRGTDWVFKYSGLRFVSKGLIKVAFDLRQFALIQQAFQHSPDLYTWGPDPIRSVCCKEPKKVGNDQNNGITPWSTVLLHKPTVPKLVKKFPAFYGTRMFITAFTSARHLSLSSARSIQSMSSYLTSWRPILIVYSHLQLGLQVILSQPKPCITFPIRATCPAHLILLILALE